MKDAIADMTKFGLKHSTAQGLLIFSGILVIVSILSAGNYVFVSFFTLFYALIAHYLTVLRKHESLGEYFVGNDKWQVIWFTLSYILYFLWWSTGVWALLDKVNTLNLLNLISISFSNLSFYILSISLIVTVILFIRFFKKLLKKS